MAEQPDVVNVNSELTDLSTSTFLFLFEFLNLPQGVEDLLFLHADTCTIFA